MRKCSSAPQLAGQERQLHLARAGSRGLSAKGGTGGGTAGATSRLGTASCNSLASLGEDDGGSPRKATLPGQSLSSGNLGSLGSGGLGPRRGSGHSAGSPRSVRAASGTFGCAGGFSGSGGGGGTLSGKSLSSSSLSSAAVSGSTLQRGAKALKPPPAAKRGPTAAQAFLLDTPLVPPQQLPFEQLAEEAGEWMMEGASHGIASTDCFELFGFPEDAPNLRDPDSPGADEAKKAQERARRTAEAACLLTPATGQERDMGAQLHAAVRRAAVESEAQTQANYAEEIRRQAAETLLEELDATLASPDKASPRRRRRAEDEKLDAEVLKIIVDDSTGEEPVASADDHSPRTRQALAAMFAERQPSRNMLTIDEEDLPLASADVAASIDLPHSCPTFPAAEPSSSKDAAPEFGSHPAYQPPLVLVDSASGNHIYSTSAASGAGGGSGPEAAGRGDLGGSGIVAEGGPLSRGGSGIESPFARQFADADSSKGGPGAGSDGNPGAQFKEGSPGIPALASVRPRSTSAPLAQAVRSANSAANAAPPAGGGASPGSAHPAVPPQPSAVPASAPRRTTAEKATQTPDDQPPPKQVHQQPADSGGKAGGAGGCGGDAAGGGSRSKTFDSGSGRGLGGRQGADGAVSSNAVPFIRPRSKAVSGHDGAAGNI